MRRLKFYGLGGQGVVTAGKTLSTAVSIYDGKYAITVPAYGHERRGAPVYTDIVVDEEPILANCFVYEPDIVLVMDDSIIEKNVDVAKGKRHDTALVLNTRNPEVAEMYANEFGFNKVFYVDATQIAIDCIGREIPNGPMLGALAITGIAPIEAIENALKDIFGERAGEKNAKAARKAYEQVKEI
ncbi:MAG: 2-oxoacid:acceptor oxidoreductase family protein [Clostridiales bacterium]|jgi:2-oxoacid:acceptor oxidoreductase gamma subunit (pyruvate/2-ketoisovalerate family)|nr:2-oxoacid:acceptor oxidoreductase family protein [Clostridiales bacterium]